MSPLRPITTIFMMSLLFYLGSWKVAILGLGGRVAVLRLRNAASAGHITLPTANLNIGTCLLDARQATKAAYP